MSMTAYAWAASILYLVIPAVLFWRVAAKAGYPAWYALLALVPVVNVIALWLFAYGEWPRLPYRREPS